MSQEMYGTWMRLASFGEPFLIKVSLNAENAVVVAKTKKKGQPGPLS